MENHMKYRKQIRLFLLTVVTLGSLAGCAGQAAAAPEGAAQKPGEPGASQEQAEMPEVTQLPETMKKEINGVEFDLELEVPEALDLNGIKRSTATRQAPKMDAVAGRIEESKTLVEERGTPEGEGSDSNSYYAMYEDNSMVSLNTTMTYSTPFFEKIHNSFREENTDKYTEEKAAFGTPEECFEKLMGEMAQFGYPLEDCDYAYYTLDYATMEQEEVITDKSGEAAVSDSAWSEQDDCYYFFAEQVHDGIPVYFGEQNFPQDTLENRPLQAVYSSAGLQRLDAGRLYQFTSTGEQARLADFEEIAGRIADKYGNILTGASYKAVRAKLYQMPVDTGSGAYEVKLVWLFEVIESGKDSETGEDFANTLYTCIDAETGEEVVIE